MKLRGIFGATAGLLWALSVAGQVAADNPARLAPVELTDGFGATIGGDSVSGGGEWAVVTDSDFGVGLCRLLVYRLDYTNMTWGDPQQIIEDNRSCDGTDFGFSSSLVGDVLVVGAPGFPNNNNRGFINLYGFDGTEWVRTVSLFQSPVNKNGQRFGESVSVSQSPENPDEYLIAVGAPLGDQGNNQNDNRGRVFVFRYNPLVTNNPGLAGTLVGGMAGNQLGNAVTTDFPFVLAGAPGANADAGLLKLAQASTNGSGAVSGIGSPDTYEVSGFPNEGLGQEVSLSGEFMLASGVSNAFAWEFSAYDPSMPFAPRTYALREDGGGAAFAFPSFGGDVSQSDGVSAFGVVETAAERASIYRNPIDDTTPSGSDPGERVAADVYVDFMGDLSEIGVDIRLVNEFLWFADPIQERALIYQFPAGYGQRERDLSWSLRSVPCDVSGKTVADVFGSLGLQAANDAAEYWTAGFAVLGYDGLGLSSTPYEFLGPGDTISDGYSVFILFDAFYANQVESGVIADNGYLSIEDCAGFTSSDQFASDETLLDGGIPFFDDVKAQKNVQLPDSGDAGDPGGADYAWVMVNNPYPRPIALTDVRYTNPTGVVTDLLAADDADFVDSTAYVYDPVTPNIGNGQNYSVVNSVTPPFNNGRIGPNQGFFIKVEENGKAGVAGTHVLHMPQPE